MRNPMYVAVVAAIMGQSLILWQPRLLLYAGLVLAAVSEPQLRRRYGAAYERYCRSVPGWWPRWRAWKPIED